MPASDPILKILKTLRLSPQSQESYIQDIIEDVFNIQAIPYLREARIGSRCRIDFLVGRVGIEIKKGVARRSSTWAQLQRYEASGALDEIILVVGKRMLPIPREGISIPVHFISLDANWGVSV